MAMSNRTTLTAPSRVRDSKDDRFEQRPHSDRQIRIVCSQGAALSDAELEQVSAAGGRVDPGGANN